MAKIEITKAKVKGIPIRTGTTSLANIQKYSLTKKEFSSYAESKGYTVSYSGNESKFYLIKKVR